MVVALCMLAVTVMAERTFAQAGAPPFVGTNAGAPISGESILFSDAVAADIASSGCRLVRLNFIAGASGWTSTRLGKYDTIVQNARNNNLEILAVFSNETQNGTQAQWNENYNTTGLNNYITNYAATASMLMDRYKNDIRWFEIWNEPTCWSVPPSSNPLNAGCTYLWPRIFANLTAETYKKAIADHGANFFSANELSLVSGGLFAHDIGGSFSTAADYTRSVYQQTSVWNSFENHVNNPTGRRYPWDYFGYHFYLNQGSAVSTTELSNYFNDVRVEQNLFNDTAPFFLTEFGWTIQGVGETVQAQNVTNTYNWLKTQSDIVAGIWYQWNCCDPNGDWGLVYSIGNPKPSYFAFADQTGNPGVPVANFSAFPLSGEVPLNVQFSNASSGDITGHAWDFGDDATSQDPNPQHLYTAPGTYTVSLTVSGDGGQDTETKTDYITVDPPAVTIPGDFNGDNRVNEIDLVAFIDCLSGADVQAAPSGCETSSGSVVSATANWEAADDVAGLSESIDGSDLIAGVTGVQEAGGFHPATPTGNGGGLVDLTDGQEGTNVEAVLVDYPGGDPSNTGDPANRALQVRYDFSPPVHLERIRVFAANVSDPGSGRVFQNYDVEYSVDGDSAYQTLIEDVVTGAFLQSNNVSASHANYKGATLTEVAGASPGPIALDVDALRFAIYPVSQIGGLFVDELEPGEPGDTDGQREAFESSIIKEIDVFAYTGVLSGGNKADLDGDGDADLDDFAIMQSCFSGQDLADPTCGDRP